MRIDHVVYGVNDLDAATARFAAAYGLSAAERGEHPDLGTANALLPVGAGQYIELLAPAPGSSQPVATILSQMLTDGDRPLAVCLRPGDLDAQARRLGLEPRQGRREAADSSVRRWRLLGMEAALGPQRLPFFIDWGPDLSAHEAAIAVGTDTAGIAWVEVGGEVETLGRWLGAIPPALRCVGGAPGVRTIALQRGDALVLIS